MFSRVVRALTTAVLVASLGGCAGSGLFAETKADDTQTGAIPAGLAGASATDAVSIGKKQFAEGNYGNAEAAFRRSVELGPHDAEAWLGLAASYDRLKRFDLADRAYAQTIRLVGRTAVVLNNQGFSYMLRGDLKTAEKLLLQARKQDPTNPNVQANIELLGESAKLAKNVR